MADYDEVVALLDDPRTAEGDFLLAQALTRMRRFDEARAILENSRWTRRPMAIALRANIETRLGRHDEALCLLKIAEPIAKTLDEEHRLAYEAALSAIVRGDDKLAAKVLRRKSFGSISHMADELRGQLAVRNERFAAAIPYFEKAGFDPDTWTRYHALNAAAYLAREMYLPNVMRSVEALLVGPPPKHLTFLHFQIVRSSAWFLAIKGDFQGALERLSEASDFAHTDAHRCFVLADSGYVSLAYGEKINGWNDLDAALRLARRTDWKQCVSEDRRILLTLATLQADRRTLDAKWCLREYLSLAQPEQNLETWFRGARHEAFESFARGAIARAEGDLIAAHAAFGKAFSIFQRIGYDWRAVLTFLARLPTSYSQGAAPEYISAILNRYPNSWLRALAEKEVSKSVVAESPAISSLTSMQRKVTALIAKGQSNPKIAAALGRKPATIAEHVTKIMRALNCKTRQEVQRYCAEVGFPG